MFYVEQILDDGVLATKQMLKTGIESMPSFLKKDKKINSSLGASVAESNPLNRPENQIPPANTSKTAQTSVYDNIISNNTENINTFAEASRSGLGSAETIICCKYYKSPFYGTGSVVEYYHRQDKEATDESFRFAREQNILYAVGFCFLCIITVKVDADYFTC